MKTETAPTLAPGCGYWDCTHYPIGGKFCRAPESGLPLKSGTLEKFPRGYGSHGCDASCETADGRKIAFSLTHVVGNKRIHALDLELPEGFQAEIYGFGPHVQCFYPAQMTLLEAWSRIEAIASEMGYAMTGTLSGPSLHLIPVLP